MSKNYPSAIFAGMVVCCDYLGGMSAGGYMSEQAQSISRVRVRREINYGHCSFSSTESLLQMCQKRISRLCNIIFLQNCLPFSLHFPLQTDSLSSLSVCTQKIFSLQIWLVSIFAIFCQELFLPEVTCMWCSATKPAYLKPLVLIINTKIKMRRRTGSKNVVYFR